MNFENLPIIDFCSPKEKIPSSTGIYFWFDRSDDKLVYLGVAIGKNGLKKRIIFQHLQAGYIEFRSKVFTKDDEYQKKHGIERKSTVSGSIEYGIDKSPFRKAIGRKFKIKPGIDTVNYIKENLYLKLYTSEDISELRSLEKQLIKDHNPVFNTLNEDD
jgi:excinuclease UvrABC nuclease subunit